MNPETHLIFSLERQTQALRMLAVLEQVKSAVQQFDDGEINLDEAVRLIAESLAARKAA